MAQEFSVVQVGCGSMGNGWVDNLLKTPGVKLAGLVDISRAAAEAMAQRHQLPASVVFNNLKEALAATKANVVFDVTIPAAHEAVVTEALRAGCDVLGEKPMSDSMDSARRMVAVAKETGRTYAVTQNYRYVPQIQALRKLLRDEQIGAIEELHADMFLGPHFGGFRETMKYPLLLDMSIHTFDAARFLLNADPVSAYCHSFNPKRSWFGHDASAVCIFEFSDGQVFTLRASWCAQGLDMPFSSHWRAIAGAGSATWDGQELLKAQRIKEGGKKEFFYEKEDVTLTPMPMSRTGHGALMDEFFAALREGRKPETSCQDNIKSLAMVFAAVESAEKGQKMAVKW